LYSSAAHKIGVGGISRWVWDEYAKDMPVEDTEEMGCDCAGMDDRRMQMGFCSPPNKSLKLLGTVASPLLLLLALKFGRVDKSGEDNDATSFLISYKTCASS